MRKTPFGRDFCENVLPHVITDKKCIKPISLAADETISLLLTQFDKGG